MAAPEIERFRPNMLFSWFRFLDETLYVVDSVEQTLKQRFSGLQLVAAYPDSLFELKAPIVAITGTEVGDGQVNVYGEGEFGLEFLLHAYGFVVGQGGGKSRAQANRIYSDRLMSDIQGLVFVARSSGIPLYDHASKAALGKSAEVLSVVARTIPRVSPITEADEHRFLVEARVEYVSPTEG
jgi:hypothetical protein